jgi:hypothetical protein
LFLFFLFYPFLLSSSCFFFFHILPHFLVRFLQGVQLLRAEITVSPQNRRLRTTRTEDSASRTMRPTSFPAELCHGSHSSRGDSSFVWCVCCRHQELFIPTS